MPGNDKCLVSLSGMPLYQRVIERLRPQCRRVVIAAHASSDAFRHGDAKLCLDRRAEQLGPLAALEAAMSAAETPYLVTVPCDSPFIPLDLVERLSHALTDSHPVVVAESGGRRHHGCLLARTDRVDSVTLALEHGHLKVSAWLASQNAATVAFAGDEHDFLNINTPADLLRARRFLDAAKS